VFYLLRIPARPPLYSGGRQGRQVCCEHALSEIFFGRTARGTARYIALLNAVRGLHDEDPKPFADAAKERVQDWSAQTGEAVRQTGTQIADKTASMADRASAVLHDAGDSARDTMTQIADKAASVADRTSHRAARYRPRSGRSRAFCRISPRTEDRAASEAAHCWGRRMSFNTSSHKISGIAFTGFGKRDELRGDSLFDALVQSPVRRARQTISSGNV
jgi:ElaB/YqjD/DUF883 family membrane-anchored ribosome-binding protein